MIPVDTFIKTNSSYSSNPDFKSYRKSKIHPNPLFTTMELEEEEPEEVCPCCVDKNGSVHKGKRLLVSLAEKRIDDENPPT